MKRINLPQHKFKPNEDIKLSVITSRSTHAVRKSKENKRTLWKGKYKAHFRRKDKFMAGRLIKFKQL